MTVLRSREVLSPTPRGSPLETVAKGVEIEPLTPAKAVESTKHFSGEETPSPVQLGLRRSVRLSSKLGSVEVSEEGRSRGKRKAGNVKNGVDLIDVGGKKRSGSVRSTSKAAVVRVLEDATGKDVVSDSGIEVDGTGEKEKAGAEKVSADVGLWGASNESEGCLSLRSGKKILKSGVKRGDDNEEPVCEDSKKKECRGVSDSDPKEGVVHDAENEKASRGVGSGIKDSRRRINREDKKKGALVDGIGDGAVASEIKVEVETSEEMEIDWKSEETGVDQRSQGRFTREEKGKGKIGEVGLSSNLSSSSESCSDSEVESLVGRTDSVATNVEPVRRQSEETTEGADTSTVRDYKERFKKVAKSNASRFAFFAVQEEEEDPIVDDTEMENPEEDTNVDVEDWPGPFSTAMKIIRDRAAARQPKLSLEKPQLAPLAWIPKKNQQSDSLKRMAPTLQEICIPILVENVEAIISLESVPDSLRHKLTQLLCDCRKMNSHFLELLTSGSPSEIRVRDSSWLTEENFTKTFERTNINKLMVLQLDQCGRCLPDYVLFTTLARSPNELSALTTISLKGACRLSDSGLSALVTSAPALRSVNLGYCSLLTSDGINELADKLRSVLKELYIDVCTGVDAMRILPALMNVEHLEVLSMTRFESVCDAFIKRLVAVRGQNMKEFILAECPRLTDSSLKAIGENCPGLCAIDLSELRKLTDSAIGYLANGCRGIQTLILRRCAFSDEAVAAYLEACGQPLKELSLNHVDKVAHDTALSLSKHSRNLVRLDLSWCRLMTDEAVGLIADNCSLLKMLKLFGCTQITSVFTDGHSNQHVKVLGLGCAQNILKNIEVPDLLPLRYSSASI